jgi:hypothetical protein
MPIEHLDSKTEYNTLGKFKLGFKDPAKNGAPTATDYFVIDAEDEIKKEIIDIYGDKPKELKIRLTDDDIEKVFPRFLYKFSASKLLCKGDGITASYTDDKGEYQEKTCQGKQCPDFMAGKCTPNAGLVFTLIGINRIGCFEMWVSSQRAIVNIRSSLEALKTLTNGSLAGIPLKLVLKSSDIIAKGIKRTIHIPQIDVVDAKSLLPDSTPSKQIEEPKKEIEQPKEEPKTEQTKTVDKNIEYDVRVTMIECVEKMSELQDILTDMSQSKDSFTDEEKAKLKELILKKRDEIKAKQVPGIDKELIDKHCKDPMNPTDEEIKEIENSVET